MNPNMLIREQRPLFLKFYFWFLLVLTALPLVLFPLYNSHITGFTSYPVLLHGVMDLNHDPFKHSKSIPLEGTWEFYWEQWIVTDQQTDQSPDALVYVPNTWNHYNVGETTLTTGGYASYRLLLKNCPTDMVISCYVPNLGSAYRVFLNGTLVAQSGVPTKTFEDTSISFSIDREPFVPFLTQDSELVIETSACHSGGLYMTPILVDVSSDVLKANTYRIIASMYVGMLVLLFFFYLYILSFKDVTSQFLFMMFMAFLIFLRILSKDEMYGILNKIVPIFQYHTFINVLQVLSFLMPTAFILWINDVMPLRVNCKLLLGIVLYDMILTIPLFYFFMNGYLMAYTCFYAAALLPSTVVLYPLYRQVKQRVPYSLTISASFMFLLSCLMMSCMYACGIVSYTLSLYASSCFVIAMFLQVSIYSRKDRQLRTQALESTKLRLELQEKETALMLSQIKPHFLYNALIAIQVLCLKDPAGASEAIGQFSLYLRANMGSLSSSEPIPFEQELNHITNYAAIEKLRFRDRLNMVYDIQVKDFKIPVLTIQPLVENAIKHGVCHKITGGTVTLRTFEDENHVHIEVLDDGVGFSPDKLDSNKDSYGIRNISFRLKEKANAQIDIKSKPEEGTRVLILLPKEGRIHERNYNR